MKYFLVIAQLIVLLPDPLLASATNLCVVEKKTVELSEWLNGTLYTVSKDGVVILETLKKYEVEALLKSPTCTLAEEPNLLAAEQNSRAIVMQLMGSATTRLSSKRVHREIKTIEVKMGGFTSRNDVGISCNWILHTDFDGNVLEVYLAKAQWSNPQVIDRNNTTPDQILNLCSMM